MTNEHNPPAFPCREPQVSEFSREPFYIDHTGLTLRDYFASHSGITFQDAVFVEPVKNENYGEVFVRLAKMRLAYANAMLAERAKA